MYMKFPTMPLADEYLLTSTVFDVYTLRQAYYDPVIGRFTTFDDFEASSSDPMALHKYVYANNNPINMSDPSGHFAEALAVTGIQNILNSLEFAGFQATYDAVAGIQRGLNANDVFQEFLIQQAEGIGAGLGLAAMGRVWGLLRNGISIPDLFTKEGPIPMATFRLFRTQSDISLATSYVKPLAGYHDVIVHGSEEAVHAIVNGSWVEMDHRVLANYLRANGYNGGPIRLLSCSTGKLDTGLAQNLANDLGTDVYAPTDILDVYPNGDLKVRNGGSFKKFTPRPI